MFEWPTSGTPNGLSLRGPPIQTWPLLVIILFQLVDKQPGIVLRPSACQRATITQILLLWRDNESVGGVACNVNEPPEGPHLPTCLPGCLAAWPTQERNIDTSFLANGRAEEQPKTSGRGGGGGARSFCWQVATKCGLILRPLPTRTLRLARLISYFTFLSPLEARRPILLSILD